jgi:hypothetical protein
VIAGCLLDGLSCGVAGPAFVGASIDLSETTAAFFPFAGGIIKCKETVVALRKRVVLECWGMSCRDVGAQVAKTNTRATLPNPRHNRVVAVQKVQTSELPLAKLRSPLDILRHRSERYLSENLPNLHLRPSDNSYRHHIALSTPPRWFSRLL